MSSFNYLRPITARAVIRASTAVPGSQIAPNLYRPTIILQVAKRLASLPSQSRKLTSTTHPGSNRASRPPSNFSQRLSDPEKETYRHPTFDVFGRVYVVTGGARGLGLTLAEALAENGAHVHCLDVLPSPSEEYETLQSRVKASKAGSVSYEQVDVTDASSLDEMIRSIADKYQRLDGLVAAAGIQNTTPALDYPPEAVDKMLAVNFKGVYLSSVSCARQMIKYKIPGSLLLVASTSAFAAIKGLNASVYSGSKAGVVQLARSLAMEWGKAVDGKAIRVNALCPGNTLTPMVRNDFNNHPGLREVWENANMMGRIAETKEYKGATLFLLSDASSFMTGASLVIDGGYTAW